MTHDPTANEIDSSLGKMSASSVSMAEPSVNRKPRRKLDLSGSESAIVDKTRAQIRELVDEVRQLGQGDCSRNDFYEGLLSRVVMALASIGGAVWVRDVERSAISLQCHVNLKQTSLSDSESARKTHGKLIDRVFQSGSATLVPPATGSASPDSGGNPTEYLLILGPVEVDGQVAAVIEIFQRSGAGPATQRGYQRFLSQICEITSEFLLRAKMRSLEDQQKTWRQLQRLVQSLHQRLDVNDTVYAIANEGRRLIDCDRVSVATMRGSRCAVKTVSGLDTIERRSDQVKTLGKLATAVVRSRKPLWFDGDTKDLPPQIERRVEEHVEKSHARMTAVIPLFRTEKTADSGDPFETPEHGPGKPVGALIVEQLNTASTTEQFQQRVEMVATHAQTALTNSIDHQSIFLLPLWKTIGKLSAQFQGSRLLRTLGVLGAIVALGAFLCLFPYQFALGARGSLVPEKQTEIYAKLDGVLTEIHVSNSGDTLVEQGQLLATMASSTLELRIGDLEGRIGQAKKELRFANDGKNSGADPEETKAYSFQAERARQTILNLQSELKVLLKDRDHLEVRAPTAGRIVNWQVRQNLLRRPVRFGQHLMTVVPPETQWLMELEMPERRLAHLTRAMKKSDELLVVSLALESWPGNEFEGQLISVDQKLDVYSDEGNAALVRVSFPNDSIPEELLLSGARVRAKVDCGTRPIGYALFYELIETVQSKWQFWF